MLVTENISFAYQENILLHPMKVSVNPVEFVAIVGPNGAGKSTLLSLLSDEMRNNKEVIMFKDKAYQTWDLEELPRHKAKFSQQFSSDIPLEVEAVVMMGRYPYFEHTPSIQDLEAVTEAMKATDVLPLKSRAYNSLSGGEKQRVHLSRVLAQLYNSETEKLLFLDEPLNNLDVLHQYAVMQLLKKFVAQGNTAVVVLHDLNLAAQFASQVILLQKGKLIQNGTPTEVFTQETISKVYNFPCTICCNPLNQNPLILFGT